MPRGSDSFNKHKAAVEQRRENATSQFGPQADYFGIDGGQFAAVRFLEEGADIAWAATHRVPAPGRRYPQDVVCLDQEDEGTPCPFCASEHKDIRSRSTKGFYNVIWRGNIGFQQVNQSILANNQAKIAQGLMPDATYTLAPVYKRNEWNSPAKDQAGNKIILGYEDGVFLWKASKTVHDLIVSKDSTYHGLMSRDFVVRREGSTKEDTKYYIEPLQVDQPPQPLTEADQALLSKKYDLGQFIDPMPYEQAAAMLSGVPTNQPQGQQPTFARGGQMSGMPPAPPVPVSMPSVGMPDPSAPSPFQAPPAGTMQ